MKLSDMFSNLARNAEELEKRVAKWQEDLGNRNDDLMSNARKWRDQAGQRQADLNEKVKGYFDDANEQVKAQWEKAKSDWDGEVAKMQAKGEEMRQAASNMQEDDMADWTEAYAANMVAYAQQVQDEASNAVAAATEARAKAQKDKA